MTVMATVMMVKGISGECSAQVTVLFTPTNGVELICLLVQIIMKKKNCDVDVASSMNALVKREESRTKITSRKSNHSKVCGKEKKQMGEMIFLALQKKK